MSFDLLKTPNVGSKKALNLALGISRISSTSCKIP